MTPAERVRAAIKAERDGCPGYYEAADDQLAAAVCEALADVVIPDDPSPEAQQDVDQIERKILAIAAELRGEVAP